MLPPSAQKQQQWCVSMLKETIQTVAQIPDVQLTMDMPLPHTHDMRKLKQWWMTLGFHTAWAVMDNLGAGAGGSTLQVAVKGTAETVTVTLESSSGQKVEQVLCSNDNIFYFSQDEKSHTSLQGMHSLEIVICEDIGRLSNLEAFCRPACQCPSNGCVSRVQAFQKIGSLR